MNRTIQPQRNSFFNTAALTDTVSPQVRLWEMLTEKQTFILRPILRRFKNWEQREICNAVSAYLYTKKMPFVTDPFMRVILAYIEQELH